jgi:hypothetical protein
MIERFEEHAGVIHVVRPIAGGASGRVYRCPGCDHEISAATPHVVVWPADSPDAAGRRHWHTPCWQARATRAVAPRRHR